MILNLQFLYVLLFTPLSFLNMLYIYLHRFVLSTGCGPKAMESF